MPDLTFIMDVPPEMGLARASGRGQGVDRFEAEHVEYHRLLREGFREIAEREPERCVLVDGTASADAIAVRLWMVVSERFMRQPNSTAAAPRVRV
jgi:dTMP kinase